MLYLLSLIIYFLLFAFLTWRQFGIALALFFFALPSYLIRFDIGPLPTTLLEVMFGIIVVVWTVRYREWIMEHGTWIIRRHKILFCAIALFLLAATISVFTSSNLRGALGEWKAFYFEPILLFLILITTLNQNSYIETSKDKKTKRLKDYSEQKSFNLSIFQSSQIHLIILALTLSSLITSLLAIHQHFTGWMVPDAFWTNQNTFRVTAWYGFPNAVGLFLAPIVPLAIYLVSKRKSFNLSIFQSTIITTISFLYIPASLLVIIFAKSTGALVGLAAGLLFFLFFYNKKTRLIACLVSLVGIVSLISLPTNNQIKQELLFQDRSGQIRLGIWNETIDFLKDNPLWGAGLASYQEKIRPYHKPVNGENIEIFHHPHNIFLTMWANLGLLGLVSFILIIIWFFKTALSRNTYHVTRNNSTIYLSASMVVILVAGLVDSPYIKNDLAMLFWLLPATLISFHDRNNPDGLLM